MQNILIVINEAPYGTEKAYNAMRTAMALQKEYGGELNVKVFLMADGVFCALPNQSTPNGYYNIERMLRAVIQQGGEVKSCGSCLSARGMEAVELIEGVQPSNMKEFTRWIVECDKVLSF